MKKKKKKKKKKKTLEHETSYRNEITKLRRLPEIARKIEREKK